LNLGELLFTASETSLYDVIKYINENISENLTNTKLAEIARFHPRYFIRLFKKQFGTTPHRYIQNIRVKYAVNMLQNGYKIKEYLPSLLETALADGYEFVTVSELLLQGDTTIDANGVQKAM